MGRLFFYLYQGEIPIHPKVDLKKQSGWTSYNLVNIFNKVKLIK